MQRADKKKGKKRKKKKEVEVVHVILNNALMYGGRSCGVEANRSGWPSQPRPPSPVFVRNACSLCAEHN